MIPRLYIPFSAILCIASMSCNGQHSIYSRQNCEPRLITCFRSLELSLTLLELPKQYEIEAGTEFKHVFSMSYTNLFDATYQKLNIASLPNKGRRRKYVRKK